MATEKKAFFILLGIILGGITLLFIEASSVYCINSQHISNVNALREEACKKEFIIVFGDYLMHTAYIVHVSDFEDFLNLAEHYAEGEESFKTIYHKVTYKGLFKIMHSEFWFKDKERNIVYIYEVK